MSAIPAWLSRRLHTLKRTGVLTLIKEKNVDLASLQIKDMCSYIQFIKTLDLTGTPIQSIENLPFLPRITSFIADYSELQNCINFSAISTTTSISVKKTPLSKLPHYKLSILLAVGPNIVKIDGKMISPVLLNRYKKYPEYVRDLVNKGWVVEYPCPSPSKLLSLCKQYKVEIPDEEEQTEFPPDEEETFVEEEAPVVDFDSLAQKLWNQHEDMLQKKQAMFGIIDDDESDITQDESEFGNRIAALFKSHGYEVNPSDNKSILEAIDELCKRTDIRAQASSQNDQFEEF